MEEWKIKRDYFYADLYEQYGLKWIEHAGFFFDSYTEMLDIKKHIDIPCTPVNFMRDSYSKAEKPVVLVTTGSFCPIHQGHIDMMESAKSKLIEEGFDVVGGLICPDHDEYVFNKVSKGAIPIHARLDLIERSLKNHPWLAADPWGGMFVDCDINFTDVVYRTELYLKKYLGDKVQVVFVCGGDCSRFMKTFKNKGMCVVVDRPGSEMVTESIFAREGNERIFIANGQNEMSSTEVRKKLNWNHNVKHAIIRTDYSGKETEVMFPHLVSRFDSIKINDTKTQKITFAKSLNFANVISMDPIIPGKYNLQISRLYDCFGMKFLGYTNRPGSPSLEEQIKAIPDGEYILFDDDIATGGTMAFAKELFNKFPEKKIVGFHTLSKSNPNEEIVDVRDFIKGKEDSGLVVQSPSGKIERVPYLHPYINVYSRASINDPIEFSKIVNDLVNETDTGNN